MPRSYKDLLEEGETKRIESNLSNLVTARLLLVEERQRLSDRISEIDNAIVGIDEVGEKKDPSYGEVKKVYEAAIALRNRT